MEKEIKMAAKLYKCRDTAKSFLRDEYPTKLKPYTDLLLAVMRVNNLEAIPALLKISETDTYQNNPLGQMMFMAAVVEMMKPTDCNLK